MVQSLHCFGAKIPVRARWARPCGGVAAGLLWAAMGSPAVGQSLSIPWWTVDGGGGRSSGGTFELSGTVGQPDAGVALTGGTFRLTGGFWVGAAGGPPRCVADVDDGTGTGVPDGGVTLDDLLYYLDLFTSGDARADVDDGTFTNTRDGGVTLEDLLYYISRYEAGC